MASPFRRVCCFCVTAAVVAGLFRWNLASIAQEPDQELERVIHCAAGSAQPGVPKMADEATSGRVRISVVDLKTNEPVHCRVNVVGPDGDYYEPRENLLAPWSLSRLGNRPGKGPFRYYGWFFYSNGQSEVSVPPGKVRVEVWKGLEFRPEQVEVEAAAGKSQEVRIRLERVADLASRGWYSGDTHIHLDRKHDVDDARALDLAAAEDIRFAHILCMNDPRTYQPLMEQQIWHQLQGMGRASERTRGIYQIASGQEYRCNTFGHICLIGGRRLVDADGLKTDPNNWPPFGVVADELHGVDGFAFHAHGGYGKEIYADLAQRSTDGVELLQFAEYRDFGLEGWYHVLNAGFRFPAVGASDYPYCRALGDCRTYVQIAGGADFTAWNRGAAAGRSFFTTGPLVELSVEGKLPGETVSRPAGKQSLRIQVRVQSPVSNLTEVQLIVGGQVRQSKKVEAVPVNQPLVWDTELDVDTSTWLAVRAFAKSPQGREDSDAHTNPVYVSLAGGAICQRASVEWLLKKLDERIAVYEARQFDQRPQLLAYFAKSRQALLDLLQ